jgi:hypothetical protein
MISLMTTRGVFLSTAPRAVARLTPRSHAAATANNEITSDLQEGIATNAA